MRIAVMQPYFLPYTGYFRLFSACDLFVIFDDVQFPRRGWVHRNRFTDANGRLEWLTLPLEKGPQATTTIADLRFRIDAQQRLAEQVARFPLFLAPAVELRPMVARVLQPRESPLTYLESLLVMAKDALGLATPTLRSSSLSIDPDIHGWERLVAIVRALGADTYVNAPGGRELYSPEVFRKSGVALRFLSPWQGHPASVLQALHEVGCGPLRRQLLEQTILERG